nr:MAG TPA: hypothetical protein [Bacteriophage sp.]
MVGHGRSSRSSLFFTAIIQKNSRPTKTSQKSPGRSGRSTFLIENIPIKHCQVRYN